MVTRIDKCRICESKKLECVLDLGEQMLTGVFPTKKNADITKGPLRLVKCMSQNGCGLLQMEHSYDLDEMYGENYGYRSGLNASMVSHLKNKVDKILTLVSLTEGDLIVDIGSNDSTTLQAYPDSGLNLVGVDPTGIKFRDYYPPHIDLIPEFFSSAVLKERFPNKKAKIITSFSMFYDLESPMQFMQEVYDVLDDDGIWVFEQSYMPTMLEKNSYDTICHEHLEFYALHQIKWMADRVGFKIIDVELNNINGGSFSVVVSKVLGNTKVSPVVQIILDNEMDLALNTLKPYEEFKKRVVSSRDELLKFIENVQADGKTIAALGASTKGNVLLQYCGLTDEKITCVGEVNSEKYGCYTPGTWLKIIPESELLLLKPDYLLVLPWHFRDFFESIELFSKMNLVFPLPELEVVTLP